MRNTFRSRQRKIMCFSVLQTGRLIWLPALPELRGRLRSARERTPVGQRKVGGRPGDSAGRGMCVGSLCQLLEAGSLKAAAPAVPTASWIRDLHTGSTWSPLKRRDAGAAGDYAK